MKNSPQDRWEELLHKEVIPFIKSQDYIFNVRIGEREREDRPNMFHIWLTPVEVTPTTTNKLRAVLNRASKHHNYMYGAFINENGYYGTGEWEITVEFHYQPKELEELMTLC